MEAQKRTFRQIHFSSNFTKISKNASKTWKKMKNAEKDEKWPKSVQKWGKSGPKVIRFLTPKWSCFVLKAPIRRPKKRLRIRSNLSWQPEMSKITENVQKVPKKVKKWLFSSFSSKNIVQTGFDWGFGRSNWSKKRQIWTKVLKNGQNGSWGPKMVEMTKSDKS